MTPRGEVVFFFPRYCDPDLCGNEAVWRVVLCIPAPHSKKRSVVRRMPLDLCPSCYALFVEQEKGRKTAYYTLSIRSITPERVLAE